MADQKPTSRPLSPHLQVYRPMLSMMMSITHRITGFTLFFGTAIFVWWLYAAANAPSAFEQTQYVFGHWLGRIVLFGFTWALLHHALGGIRHFIWDSGRGFELATVEKLVKANLIGSIVLTLFIWAIAYGVIS